MMLVGKRGQDGDPRRGWQATPPGDPQLQDGQQAEAHGSPGWRQDLEACRRLRDQRKRDHGECGGVEAALSDWPRWPARSARTSHSRP